MKESKSKILPIFIRPDEKPLFILKYVPWRIAWRLFWPYLFVLPLLCYVIYCGKDNIVVDIFIKFTGSIFIVGSLYLIYDMIDMDGIYLYENVVIKFYKSGKYKIVFLETAQYDVMSNTLYGVMRIYDENENILLRSFKGIYYDEKLVAPEDIRKFREMLAKILG